MEMNFWTLYAKLPLLSFTRGWTFPVWRTSLAGFRPPEHLAFHNNLISFCKKEAAHPLGTLPFTCADVCFHSLPIEVCTNVSFLACLPPQAHVEAAVADLPANHTNVSWCSTLALTWVNQDCLQSRATTARQNSPVLAPLWGPLTTRAALLRPHCQQPQSFTPTKSESRLQRKAENQGLCGQLGNKQAPPLRGLNSC